MNRQEFYAASVEEAVDKASSTLGIAQDQLEFEVLDRGSSGFLGLGLRDARISVQVPDQLDAPAQDSEDVLISQDRNEDIPGPVDEEPEHGAPQGPREEDDSAATGVGTNDEVILAADAFLTGLVTVMGFDATVDAYDRGDTIAVDVGTPETGLFIGQKGETIDAIQYLTNVVVYKNRPFDKRIVVDSEGYRQRRVEAIQGMAHRTARRVSREKRSISLPPMSPAERRVVHLYLKDLPSVTTASEGTDDNRKVVVRPA